MVKNSLKEWDFINSRLKVKTIANVETANSQTEFAHSVTNDLDVGWYRATNIRFVGFGAHTYPDRLKGISIESAYIPASIDSVSSGKDSF